MCAVCCGNTHFCTKRLLILPDQKKKIKYKKIASAEKKIVCINIFLFSVYNFKIWIVAFSPLSDPVLRLDA